MKMILVTILRYYLAIGFGFALSDLTHRWRARRNLGFEPFSFTINGIDFFLTFILWPLEFIGK